VNLVKSIILRNGRAAKRGDLSIIRGRSIKSEKTGDK